MAAPKPSQAEKRAFAKLAKRGVLSIAAAGNDGNSAMNYLAGYSSVMMVSGVDVNKARRTSSQSNAKVVIAAPGVDVLSTIPMNSGSSASLTVGGVTVVASVITGSPQRSATAPLADMGNGTEISKAMAGKVCLVKRGAIPFGEKVKTVRPVAAWAQSCGTMSRIGCTHR